VLPPASTDKPTGAALVDAIDALLPQTQCTKCGYQGCRPYAEAIARNGAEINRCPPGGAEGIVRLASLLDRKVVALDPACGSEGLRRIAWIDPGLCIGCTLCIQACPVDAIIGARKRMHTVIDELCTGCDLCLAPCPVDCIEMRPAPDPAWSPDDAAAARERHHQRQARLQRLADAGRPASGSGAPATADDKRRQAIEQAMQRARERLGSVGGGSGEASVR
jgi:Na+-translocating ferredoxin:NAD+ oxidoreductase subunit B